MSQILLEPGRSVQQQKSDSSFYGTLFLFLFWVVVYFYLNAYKSFEGYFTTDDIDNISWSHTMTAWQLLFDAIDPRTMATVSTYRPIGALVYNLVYKYFQINIFSYHIVEHALHFFNVCVGFAIMRTLGGSTVSAFFGGTIFTFHPAMLPIYWEFSTIFDVACAALMFSSFLLYIKANGKISGYLAASLTLFFLAIRTKEMAFMLPIILTAYEIVFRSASELRKWEFVKLFLKVQLPFYIIAVIYGLPKVLAGFKDTESAPYRIVLSLESLFMGAGFYMQALLNRNDVYASLVVLFLCSITVAILSKQRIMIFAVLYTCISFLPVIFLANHRWGVYWYIPFLGIALYFSGLVQSLQSRFFKVSLSKQIIGICALILLVVLYTYLNFTMMSAQTVHSKVHQENYYIQENRQVKNFVEQLEKLRLKPPNDSLFVFIDPPQHLSEGTLTSLLRILYHDWSIRVRIADANEKISQQPKTFYVQFRNGIVTPLKMENIR